MTNEWQQAVEEKQELRDAIEEWVNNIQEDNGLDMWISDTLIERMTDAAWAVLRESKGTQEWLIKEGHMKPSQEQ